MQAPGGGGGLLGGALDGVVGAVLGEEDAVALGDPWALAVDGVVEGLVAVELAEAPEVAVPPALGDPPEAQAAAARRSSTLAPSPTARTP
ncbi:MAG: hypothetical protein ACRDPI_05055 [Nocardioidaceae bacterium]